MVRQIREIYSHAISGNTGINPESLFLYEDSGLDEKDMKGISQSQIDTYAKGIADRYLEIKDSFLGEVDLTIILNLFSDSEIGKIFDDDIMGYEFDKEDRAVINIAISRIRKGILKSLEKYLDPGSLFLIRRLVSSGFNPLYYVESLNRSGNDFVLKRQSRLERGSDHNNKRAADAFKTYTNLKEKHPNIVDAGLYFFNDDDQMPAVLSKKINLTTLRDVLSDHSPEKKDLSLKQLIGYLIQFVDAFIFLEKHKLVLQDIALRNLGIDLDNDKAVLFDLEGLYPLGETRTNRLCMEEDVPPEAKKGKHGNNYKQTSVFPSEMVYQLGKTFLTTSGIKLPRGNQHTDKMLENLLESMVKFDPSLRTSLEDVKIKLVEILSQINE